MRDHQTDDAEYFVLNTHWDHVSQNARLYSAQLIRSQIDAIAGNRPLIVMGDLNVGPSNIAIQYLFGANDRDGFQLQDSYREAFPVPDSGEGTFNGFFGNKSGARIDYILHTDQFRTEDAGIVHTNFDGRYPSDHFPVTATLAAVTEPITGDFDADGDVDCDDLDGYIGNLGATVTAELAPLDLDNDGTITGSDANTHITTLVQTSNGRVGTFPGDLNCDGEVSVLGDVFLLIGNLDSPATSYSQGDVNFNGTVAVLGDAFILIGNLGKTNEP